MLQHMTDAQVFVSGALAACAVLAVIAFVVVVGMASHRTPQPPEPFDVWLRKKALRESMKERH